MLGLLLLALAAARSARVARVAGLTGERPRADRLVAIFVQLDEKLDELSELDMGWLDRRRNVSVQGDWLDRRRNVSVQGVLHCRNPRLETSQISNYNRREKMD